MIIPVLMYHSISNDDFFLSVKIKKFEKQLKYLKDKGFQSVNFGEKINNNKNVIITFDDGYKDNLLNALPLLKQYNFKATCFIVSNLIGKSNVWDSKKNNYKKKELLNKNDIDEWLLNGMTIGSHSENHENLIFLSDLNLINEVVNSKNKLENIFGYKINSFSYPYGKFNSKSVDCVKNNYKYAVTTLRSRLKINQHYTFLIPRVHVNSNTSMFKFFLKIKTIYEDLKYKNVQLYL